MEPEPHTRVIPIWNPTAFTIERRSALRYQAQEERLWAGWWASRGEFRIVGAILADISRTGAAVHADDAPEPDDTIWLRLGEDRVIASVKGHAVAVDRGPRGPCLIRIEFDSPCPEPFYRIAVEGPPR